MSIILKGIDLPREGKKIIHIYADGTIIEHLGDGAFSSLIQSQAIQIPKNHGRLIDGDAFIRHLQDIFCDKCGQHKKYGGIVCRTCYINDVILEYGDAPTILEAEE